MLPSKNEAVNANDAVSILPINVSAVKAYDAVTDVSEYDADSTVPNNVCAVSAYEAVVEYEDDTTPTSADPVPTKFVADRVFVEGL
jgi:hypothetical protein